MIQAALVILTALANLSIAAIVMRKNSRSATHVVLATLSIVTAIWTVCNYLALQPGPEEVRLFWVRTVMLVTTPYGTIIYLLAKSFPSSTLNVTKKRLSGLLLFNFLTASFVFTPYMFSGLKNLPGDSFQLFPAPAVILFGIGFLGFMTAGFVELARKYRHSRGITRKQLQFFVVGLVISFTLLSLTNFVAVVVFGSIGLTSFGPPLTLILCVLTSYAIIRHKLFNISKLIARAISYSVLLFFISIFYASIFFLIAYVLFPNFSSHRETTLIISTVLALLIATTLPRLKSIIEKTTDRTFYKNHYDQNALFDQMAQIITSTYDLNILARKITELLHAQIRCAYCKIVLINEKSFISFQSAGLHNKKFTGQDMSELLTLAPPTTAYEDLEDGALKAWMAEFELSLIVKMDFKGQAIGYLLFGERSSGEIYYKEDVDLLSIIADQLSVAFENALSVLEISHFNETLKAEIKKATKELQDANERLKEVDKLKDEFVSLASHELRTPMTSIKGSISAILEGYAGEISVDAKKYLVAAFNENDRLIRLVNNLLNTSRIEAGRFTFNVTDVDIHQVIREVVANMQRAAEEKHIYLKLSDDTAPLFVKADNDKIREVVINFIGNALKFTVEGGITISTSQKMSDVTISVQDTGPGIKPDDLTLLFKKFSQVKDGNDVKPAGGTGLGLYISKQIVEGLHGQIGVDSTVGRGTIFSFSLPAAHSPTKSEV